MTLPASEPHPNQFRIGLWAAVWLLLLAFGLRAHQVTALPPFNDESHHIRRAEVVWTFEDPDLSLTIGKLLSYYWFGLFGAQRLDAIFITRTVTALFALIGLAASYSLSKRLFGYATGILALYMLSFAPFLIFFDRMALTDPITTALGMLTLWASLTMLARPAEWEWGILTGVLAWLTVLAKLTGLSFALVPLFGWLVLVGQPWRERWRRYRATLLACYGALGGLLLPFVLRIIYKEAVGERISVVDTHLINYETPLDRLSHNIDMLAEALTIFLGPVWLLLAALSIGVALWQYPRRLGFLGMGLLAVWGFVVVASGVLSTRYLHLGGPLLLVMMAAGLGVVGQQWLGQRWGWVAGWGIASAWVLLFAQPFILNSWNDPRQNDYPNRDEWEYFTNFTAGYGLTQAAVVLPQLERAASGRVEVIGLVGSCHQMRLYLDENGPVHLTCPPMNWSGGTIQDLMPYLERQSQQVEPLYLLVEPSLPYTELSHLTLQHITIGRFERPFEGMTVELWQVLD